MNRRFAPACNGQDLPFKLTLVVNAETNSLAVKAQTRAGDSWTEMALKEAWPADVFSLSHIAVPILADGPGLRNVRGDGEIRPAARVADHAGREWGVAGFGLLLFRLRHNPFFPFMADHVVKWLAENAKSP